MQSLPLTSQTYLDARAANLRLGATDGLEAVFNQFNLTVVAIPSSVASSIAAIVGWPIVRLLLPLFFAFLTRAAGNGADWLLWRQHDDARSAVRPLVHCSTVRRAGFNSSDGSIRGIVPEATRPSADGSRTERRIDVEFAR